ncbi:MAG: hypothetical protein WDM77_19935 [Steroidobacteraceae bacterium]
MKVIASGVGGITASDVQLAGASKAPDHWLQRACRFGRPRGDQGAWGGCALLQHHL